MGVRLLLPDAGPVETPAVTVATVEAVSGAVSWQIGDTMRAGRAIVLTHGGVGSPSAFRDGCAAAATRGLEIVCTKGALEGAVAAATVPALDGRFNAGAGSVLRLDGRTVEMDAAVMDSTGRIAAVAAVRRVKNPILLAHALLKTPHVMLAGEGADRFARLQRLAPRPRKVPEHVRLRHERLVEALKRGEPLSNPSWKRARLAEIWNFPTAIDACLGCDTIGAVARDPRGRLAVANSTGGSSPMLLGRVGDSPLVGCGFYASPVAAVAATGIGEEIIRRMLARLCHDLIAAGSPVQQACDQAVESFPEDVSVGLIAVSGTDHGIAANRDMAWSMATAD
jgi:L-asparaginase/beta-aspartyl-peptidase (threonine type)